MEKPFTLVCGECHAEFATAEAVVDHLLETRHMNIPIDAESNDVREFVKAFEMIQAFAANPDLPLPEGMEINRISDDDILADEDLSDEDKAAILGRHGRILSGGPLTEGPFKGKTVVMAPQDRVDEYAEGIAQILDALGHPDSLVTDESTFGDFWMTRGAEAEAELDAVEAKLGIKVRFADRLVDAAAMLLQKPIPWAEGTERVAWVLRNEAEKIDAEVSLIAGKPEGIVRLFRRPRELFYEKTIGIEEVAMFAAQRKDLVGSFLAALVQEATPH